MKTFNGDRIRSLRERKNLTQRQLAEAFGITEQAVSGWETQGVKRESTLKQIAEYFSVTVDWLKSGEEQAKTGYSNYGVSNSGNSANKISFGGSYAKETDINPPDNPEVLFWKERYQEVKAQNEKLQDQIEKLNNRISDLIDKFVK